jgi:hypothetical protein
MERRSSSQANAFTLSAPRCESARQMSEAWNSLHYSLVFAVDYFNLWIRLKSVAGGEYARLNTGGSITRGNSGNGALPTLNGKKAGNKNIAQNDRASIGLLCSCLSIMLPASS